jgi:hypothetical protein
MIIEATLGKAGAFGDEINACRPDALLVKEPGCRLNDTVACGYTV